MANSQAETFHAIAARPAPVRTSGSLAWLRLKTFGVGRFYTDAEVLAPDFVAQVVMAIAAARPMVNFFNGALPELG